MERAEVEAQAQALWESMPADQRTLAAAPTLDEMPVSGTPAHAILTSMFATEQQPNIVYSLTLEATSQADEGAGDATGGKGRRRVQRTGDSDIRVTDLTIAPTPAEAEAAVNAIVAQSGCALESAPSRGRRAQASESEVRRTDTITLDRPTAELKAVEIFAASPGEFPGLSGPPSVDEMLVGGSGKLTSNPRHVFQGCF